LRDGRTRWSAAQGTSVGFDARLALVKDAPGNRFGYSREHRSPRGLLQGAMDAGGVERTICLGDVVGYGASPNETCALIRSRAAHTILGNHDAAVAGRMDYSYYYHAARHALDSARPAACCPSTWSG
jgi:hypothetical protein